MTSIYSADGKYIACTVVEASPNIVTQVKSTESDGYSALQLSYGEAKPKNANKAITGHFSGANTTPKRKSLEFRDSTINKSLGEAVSIDDVFKEGHSTRFWQEQRKGFSRCDQATWFWRGSKFYSRSAQQTESARFHWSFILSFQSSERFENGWSTWQYSGKNKKFESSENPSGEESYSDQRSYSWS